MSDQPNAAPVQAEQAQAQNGNQQAANAAALDTSKNMNSATEALASKPPEAPKTEAAEPKPQVTAETKQPKSDKFMAALEREKAFRDQERKARAAVEDLQRRENEWKSRMAAAGDPNADPIAYLEKMGVPFDKVVSAITSREPPKVEDKVKELESKLEAFKREQAEAAKRQAREQADADLAEFNRQVVAYVNKDAEKHELITAFNAQEYVPQFISQYAQNYGKVLDVDEAAKLVNDDLASVVEKIAATKWFQAKYQKVGTAVNAPPPAAPAKAVVSGDPKEARAIPSSATATAAAVEQARGGPMTPAEARAKAIEILEAHMRRAQGNA